MRFVFAIRVWRWLFTDSVCHLETQSVNQCAAGPLNQSGSQLDLVNCAKKSIFYKKFEILVKS